MAIDPPSTLDYGRYQLRGRLGKGGVATVYEAFDTRLRTVVAIKLLSAAGPSRQLLVARLEQELKLMRGARHRNVLPVFDFRTEGELDYVVMGIASGGSLQDRLDVHGPLPIQLAAGYTQQLLSALGWAHQQQVVHRDVKPQNVLLDSAGVAMLADFGIALLGGADVLDRHTRADTAMGSFAYMPPEQRLDARTVTAAADIYATGSTLYALLTAGNPVDLFTAGRTSERWGGLPDSVVEVIRCATAARAESRYADVVAFSNALSAAVQAVPPEERDRPVRPFRVEPAYLPSADWVEATRDAVTYLGDLRPDAAADHPDDVEDDPSVTFLPEVAPRSNTRVYDATLEGGRSSAEASVEASTGAAPSGSGSVPRRTHGRAAGMLTLAAVSGVGGALWWGVWSEPRGSVEAPVAPEANISAQPAGVPDPPPIAEPPVAPAPHPAPVAVAKPVATPVAPPVATPVATRVATPSAAPRAVVVASPPAPAPGRSSPVVPDFLGKSTLVVEGDAWPMWLAGGPTSVQGTVVAHGRPDRQGPSELEPVTHQVVGAYDDAQRRLTLHDVEDAPDVAVYEVNFSLPNGPGEFSGRLIRPNGEVVTIVFRR